MSTKGSPTLAQVLAEGSGLYPTLEERRGLTFAQISS